jgi:hypothetical protein
LLAIDILKKAHERGKEVKDRMPSPKDTHGPIVEAGPTAGKVQSRNGWTLARKTQRRMEIAWARMKRNNFYIGRMIIGLVEFMVTPVVPLYMLGDNNRGLEQWLRQQKLPHEDFSPSASLGTDFEKGAMPSPEDAHNPTTKTGPTAG